MTKNFSKHEVMCKCGCGGLPALAFMQKLQKARDIALIPFNVNSGFRCQKHNKAIGGRADSAHTKRVAVDIRCEEDKLRYIIVSALLVAGFTRIGIASTYIHVDDDETKNPERMWVY